MKQKLKRYTEIATLPNVLELPKNIKGKWATFFNNNHPLILELACGKGDYTLALAQMYPDKNFIGIDIKGARLWFGAKISLAKKLTNIAWLRTDIVQLTNYFRPQEISEIWITFPDPYPKKRQIKKRLTAPNFLDMYKTILKPKGILHLKTDDLDLFNYSVESILTSGFKLKTTINNIHNTRHDNDLLQIITTYEKSHIAKGRTIHYSSFSL